MHLKTVFVTARLLSLLCLVTAVLITEDYTMSGLFAVPETQNPYVEVLFLKDNEIKRFTNLSFVSYPGLIELGASYCKLQVIQDGTFDHNIKLKILDVTHNDLIYILADLGPLKQSLEVLKAHFRNGNQI